MCECRKCFKPINQEAVPMVNGICWDCQTPGDRMAIKEMYLHSPSIIERGLVEFIEWYEAEKQIKYVSEKQDRVDVNFQEQAQTEQHNFWEKELHTDGKPTGFQPKPGDKRRKAPGL